MRKKIIISLVVITLLLAVSVAARLVRTQPVSKSANNTTMPESMVSQERQPQSEPSQKGEASEGSGSYVEYSADKIATTAGTRLLFFHATWCTQCRKLESDIQSKGVPSGVTIFKVDYDSSEGLRKKYGVTLQTTFVSVDASGSMVKKYVAYDTPTLQAVLQELL